MSDQADQAPAARSSRSSRWWPVESWRSATSRCPRMFGVGQYTVTVELPQAGGLYQTGNVTYRGTEVGRVTDVRLTDDGGVEAVLSLSTGVDIPSDLTAEVHSTSAIGEQYVALVPRSGDAPPLKNGDVIPVDRTTVPPPINRLLDAANRGIQAIPAGQRQDRHRRKLHGSRRLGPELSRIVQGSTASGHRRAREPRSPDRVDRQGQAGAGFPGGDRGLDQGVGLASRRPHRSGARRGPRRGGSPRTRCGCGRGGPALFDRLKPTLPALLANLVSVGQVAVDLPARHRAGPGPGAAARRQSAGSAAGQPGRQAQVPRAVRELQPQPQPAAAMYHGIPARGPATHTRTSRRPPSRPTGELYCRIPQDSVECGARQPQLPVPDPARQAGADGEDVRERRGVRAAQRRLQLEGRPERDAVRAGRPAVAASLPRIAGAAPPIAVAEYDPATGEYLGPDGKIYTQADLGQQGQTEGKTWQSMLIPPPAG